MSALHASAAPAIFAPVRVAGRAVGVLHVGLRATAAAAPEDLEFVMAVCDALGLAIDNLANKVAIAKDFSNGGEDIAYALYVLARLVFDLCGPAQPLWWGVPLLLLGAGETVIGQTQLFQPSRTLRGFYERSAVPTSDGGIAGAAQGRGGA